jgi:adenylosuccinate lyase
MIGRYALSPMKELWSQEEKYKRWLEVEIAVVRAMEDLGKAPKGTFKKVKDGARINVNRILEIEKIVDHDVIAFIKSITENMGDEARFIHKGLTSSDVVDTAWSIAMKRSLEIILKELIDYHDSLLKLAKKHEYTITIGRTHGIHAEPTTFGLKILSFTAEAERNIERIKFVLKNVSQGKLSGAVGNYANIDPEIERMALLYLGLKPAKISTQIIPRDIHAEFLSVLSLIGASIERFATEIRHLQKTEVLEAQEPFKKGQRGSSAMPHKKNPILCERLCGMAKMLRSYTVAGYENINLWHERDISHSSVERVFIPDSTMLVHYMLIKAKYLSDNLIVYPENMKNNFNRSFNLVYSQRVLLKLIDKGMSREEAYKLIQKDALKSWEKKEDFKSIIKLDSRISALLSKGEIDNLFSNDYYTKNVSKIFDRFAKGEENE